ncbi:MAG: type II secretion system protein GspG [Candidatus Dadabacteria bacterium]|nr:MAG: type II secretion system protein GspG [Candidatus Dadabacteria bacterium]
MRRLQTLQGKPRSDRKRRAGFTLVELLVVMVILGLLASIVLPNFLGQARKARVKTARVQIKTLETALDAFALDNGRYPTTEEGLQALVERPPNAKNWDGPYLKKSVPLDPWGNPYHYEGPSEGRSYRLLSYGADGVPGGTDDAADITNED